jgi:hypothetical protein
MLFFLFLSFSAYPKPKTDFPEEIEDDEDLSVEYDDYTYLRSKEILILTNDYYKVNSFLAKKNVLISPNYILPKEMYYFVFRYVIYQDIASGRRRTKAIERQVKIKSA